MELRILGPVQARVGNKTHRLGGSKHGALLAVLLCRPNQVVGLDELIRALWGEHEPDSAKSVIEVYVHTLRRLLEPDRAPHTPPTVLVKDGDGYRLVVGPDELDASRFERLLSEGRRALRDKEPGAARASLIAALDLWAGRPFADIVAPFVAVERSRLEERRLVALEARIDADLALQRHADVVAELEALVIEHSTREGFTERLMLALYRAGRQSDALAAFARLKNQLQEESGLDPGPALDKLYGDILRQAPELSVSPIAPRDANSDGVGRPPNLLTSFIGRKTELAQLKQLLLTHRLVTLTGTGGSGKTRLALQLVSDLHEAYSLRPVFVRLASITEPDLLVPQIAAAVGLRETKAKPIKEALIELLQSQERLIVLDNFEQILESAPLVSEMLVSAPGLHIVVTSRNSLGVYGEREYSVPPLPFPTDERDMYPAPAAGYDAVRLFVERAQSVAASFALTETNTKAVVEICARLDGLPLAIELAAAQVKFLPPESLLSRLESRLKQLDRGPPDFDPRHRNLRAAIDWSYELLTPVHKQLFWRLAVFGRTWALEAAEAIFERFAHIDADELLARLSVLVDASLIQVERELEGEARFSMLETIREYALEKLSVSQDVPALNKGHCKYYLTLAQTADSELDGPRRTEWLRRLQRDHDNFRTILRTPQPILDPGDHLRLATTLRRFWLADGHLTEGYAHMQRTLATAQKDDALLVAQALNSAGVLASELSKFTDGKKYFVSSLRIGRRMQDQRGIAVALNSLGNLAWLQGAYRQAEQYYEKSLAYREAQNDKKAAALLLNNLGTLASDRGELELARTRHEASLQIREEIQDTAGVLQSLYNLGEVALRQNELKRAHLYLRQSLDGLTVVGTKSLLAQVLGGFARLAEAEADYEHAARWFGAVVAFRVSLNLPPLPLTHRATYERSQANALGALGPVRFERAWDQGTAMQISAIIRKAVEWSAMHGVRIRARKYAHAPLKA